MGRVPRADQGASEDRAEVRLLPEIVASREVLYVEMDGLTGRASSDRHLNSLVDV